MKTRKIFAYLLVIALLGGLFSTAIPGKTSASEDTTLEFWHIQNTEPMPTTIQGSVDRFMEANPDVSVNVTVMANDAFKDKIAIAIAGNQTPNIFPSWSGGPMYEYADSGVIQDITEFMEKDGHKDKFLDASIEQLTYQDKIWGYPVENVAIANFFYNKEIFEEYGLEVPTTIAELEEIADTLLENDIIPFSLANKTQWTGSMYFISFATRKGGVKPFQDAVIGEGSFENENFIYAGDKIQEWVDKGYFNEGFNGLDEDSGQSRMLLYNGDAAMTLIGSWFLYTVKSENPEFYDKLGCFQFPALEDGDGDPNTAIGTIGDNFYHVSAETEDVEAAFNMLTYLLDEQSVEERLESSKIPPLKDIELTLELNQSIFEQVLAAPDVQLWYDQSLPPAVADVHKKTSQEIFGGTLTSEEAAKLLQEAMAEYLAEK